MSTPSPGINNVTVDSEGMITILEVEESSIVNVTLSNIYRENDLKEDRDITLLSVDTPEVIGVSSPLNSVSENPWEAVLIFPEYNIHPKEVKKSAVKKTVVKREPVKKKVESKPIVKVITPKKVEKKNKPAEAISLPSMSVEVGVSFAVEMDQTGWIYEDEVEGLEFINKFYAGNKVLFEFILTDPEVKGIEFAKYSTGERVISIVPLKINDSREEEREKVVITPEETEVSLSQKDILERELLEIDKSNRPDEVYFKLAEIYLEEGQLRKAKEYYEFIYDNYPLSLYYEESKGKMEYILDNFLISR